MRLGFRYLRQLTTQYDGDLRLALLAYNRGPTRVDSIRSAGGDPGNGYATAVMRGARRNRSQTRPRRRYARGGASTPSTSSSAIPTT
jgi:soluble lytic murein transglycosylase-like protein